MAGSSKKAIYAALVGNSLIAITKFAAAGYTGSSAMMSEGIHSLVDRQRETSSELDAALGQVAESAESTQESRATLHSIVNELVKQSDELKEEVGSLWGAREEPG